MRLCLSWDDGHPDDRRVAERMAAHGLRGTFFVPLRNVEGRPVMAMSELRALNAAGFEIGAHGVDHRRLHMLPAAEMQRQLAEGRARLEDMLGQPVLGLCYPGGRHNAAIRAAAAATGYRYGRTTEMLRLDCGQDPFRLPTSLQLHPHGLLPLLRNWLRQGGGLSRLLRLAQVWRAGSLPLAVNSLGAEATRQDGVLHLWGHSWEIGEQAGGWPQLEEIFASLAALVPPETRKTCRELVK